MFKKGIVLYIQRDSKVLRFYCFIVPLLFLSITTQANEKLVYEAGHKTLQSWRLPDEPKSPRNNIWNKRRAELGKQLFFDPRLSGTGQVTCASCHFPERGWADGLPTAVRFQGKVMSLASPHLVNIAYNKIFMWDGRKLTLEEQAYGGQGKKADINAASPVGPEVVVERLKEIKGYIKSFSKVYPGEGLTRETIAKAIASFERTIVSINTPFDRWVKGDPNAMTEQQIRGFRLFADVDKGNCAGCHQAPNFTDNSFHNIGLASFGKPNYHPGRGKQVANKIMDGAFKTPALRDVVLTAPYFHDGSAMTLRDVVNHYASGGVEKSNLSPMFKKANLNDTEKEDVIAFLHAITGQHKPFIYPVLPQN